MTNFSNDTQTGVVIADGFSLADGSPIGGGYTVLNPGFGPYTLKSGESYLLPGVNFTSTILNLPVGNANSAITIALFNAIDNLTTIEAAGSDEINTNAGQVSSLNLLAGITTLCFTSQWNLSLTIANTTAY